MHAAPGRSKNTVCSSPPPHPSPGGGGPGLSLQHHRENQQLQIEAMSSHFHRTNALSCHKNIHLERRAPPLPPLPRLPQPPPFLLRWLGSRRGIFYFGFSAGGQSSPDVDSEMLPCPPPDFTPPQKSLWDGEQRTGFSMKNDGGELSDHAVWTSLCWSIIPGAAQEVR